MNIFAKITLKLQQSWREWQQSRRDLRRNWKPFNVYDSRLDPSMIKNSYYQDRLKEVPTGFIEVDVGARFFWLLLDGIKKVDTASPKIWRWFEECVRKTSDRGVFYAYNYMRDDEYDFVHNSKSDWMIGEGGMMFTYFELDDVGFEWLRKVLNKELIKGSEMTYMIGGVTRDLPWKDDYGVEYPGALEDWPYWYPDAPGFEQIMYDNMDCMGFMIGNTMIDYEKKTRVLCRIFPEIDQVFLEPLEHMWRESFDLGNKHTE